MDTSALQAPFDPSALKTRKGNFGKQLQYVEGSEYIKRLNDVFAGEWSFEIVEHAIHDAEVVVLVKLSAGSVAKMAFGGSSITVHSETGERLSLADDFKSAATDGLKKAATLLGVGLYLYCDTAPEPAHPGPNGNGHAHIPTPASNGNGQRLTQAQLAAIFKMARKLRMNSEQVRARSTELYGAVVEKLSKTDASRMITELADELGGCPV